MKRESYPTKGELVVLQVKSIKNYGAFVDIPEYKKEGFIHVSNVTSGWVKNIRSHVREGQITVGSVVNVNRDKELIDVSLRRVSSNQEKRKIQEWKRAKRAEKLLEKLCKDLNMPIEDAWNKVGWPLEDKFGDLFAAFEAASSDGEKAFEGSQLPEGWPEAMANLAKDSVSPPKVTIRGKLKMQFFGAEGLKMLKKAASSIAAEGVSLEYISAPDYMVTVTAPDYPVAEKRLKAALEKAEAQVKKDRGEFGFTRSDK